MQEVQPGASPGTTTGDDHVSISSAHEPTSPGQGRPVDVELSEYGETFKRRWRLILLCMLLGGLLAASLLYILPKTYMSSASVLVAATGQNGGVANGRTTTEVNLDTEAQLVKSSAVAKLVAEQLGSDLSPRQLAKNAEVTVPPNTSVLDVTFQATTPEEARAGAAAFAEAYLESRRSVAAAQNEAQRKTLADRIEALGSKVLKMDEEIQALPEGSIARAYKNSRRNLLLRQMVAINEQSIEYNSAETNPGEVITAPEAPKEASAPNVMIFMTSGVMLGLLAGLILAFVVDRRDRRVRDRRAIERLGLDPLVPLVLVPPLGEIATPADTRYRPESMRMLRNSLLAKMPGGQGSVIVAAASKGSAGSAVALNLAATFARGGLKVILARVGSHGAHEEEMLARTGLADVLHDRASFAEVLEPVADEPGLERLLVGRDGAIDSELVKSEHFQDVFAELRTKADILVIDAAPFSENADAQTLATVFDGVVLVATVKQTTIEDIVEAVDQLRHVSARVFGAVVAHQGTRRRATRRGKTSGA